MQHCSGSPYGAHSLYCGTPCIEQTSPPWGDHDNFHLTESLFGLRWSKGRFHQSECLLSKMTPKSQFDIRLCTMRGTNELSPDSQGGDSQRKPTGGQHLKKIITPRLKILPPKNSASHPFGLCVECPPWAQIVHTRYLLWQEEVSKKTCFIVKCHLITLNINKENGIFNIPLNFQSQWKELSKTYL